MKAVHDYTTWSATILDKARRHRGDWMYYNDAKRQLWNMAPDVVAYNTAHHRLVQLMEL